MRKFFTYFSLVIIFVGMPLIAHAQDAGSYQLNAFYPAPVGVYSKGYIKNLIILPQHKNSTSCDPERDSMYYETDNNKGVMFCNQGEQWEELGDKVWKQDIFPGEKNYIYLRERGDSAHPAKVGIGTDNPIFALTVGGFDASGNLIDGGIIARGQYSGRHLGDSLDEINIPKGTNFIWNPIRGAFRAGYFGNNTENWSEADMPMFSAAFGYKPGVYRCTTEPNCEGNNGSSQFVAGYKSAAYTYGATAIGYANQARGNYSLAVGDHSVANSLAETAVGAYNSVGPDGNDTDYDGNYSRGSFHNAYDNDQIDDDMFIVGNGNGEDSESNALTFRKSGFFGIRTRNSTRAADSSLTGPLPNIFPASVLHVLNDKSLFASYVPTALLEDTISNNNMPEFVFLGNSGTSEYYFVLNASGADSGHSSRFRLKSIHFSNPDPGTYTGGNTERNILVLQSRNDHDNIEPMVGINQEDPHATLDVLGNIMTKKEDPANPENGNIVAQGVLKFDSVVSPPPCSPAQKGALYYEGGHIRHGFNGCDGSSWKVLQMD